MNGSCGLLIAALAVVAAFLVLAKVVGPHSKEKRIIPTTLAGATEALQRVQEWATWMAGIQTAAIAGLVFLVFEENSVTPRDLSDTELFFALTAFLLLGAALFCSAWVLSSLPSQAIRINSFINPGNQPDGRYDIYEQPLYGWWERFTLGYLLNAKHWLWAGGLVFLGLFVGARLLASPSSLTSHDRDSIQEASETGS